MKVDLLSDEQLVAEFAALARERGSAVLDGEVGRANRAYGRLDAVDKELRSRGPGARAKLLPLLENRDRLVRYYAAMRLLAVAPERAREVIEWIAKWFGDPIGADARLTLDALDKGVFKPT